MPDPLIGLRKKACIIIIKSRPLHSALSNCIRDKDCKGLVQGWQVHNASNYSSCTITCQPCTGASAQPCKARAAGIAKTKYL